MSRPQVFFLCSIILTLSLARLQPSTAQITAPWEVKALKAIKGRLIDPVGHLNNWNSGDPCMIRWTGVICYNTTASDRYLHVQELQLLQLNLSGTLAPEIGQLSKMVIMDFMWNSISGGIPKEVGNITSLKLLLVNGNQLSGSLPEEIGFLPNLLRIQIDQNQISGPIPKSFAYLNKTKHFHMNNNSLSGQIPPELSRLPSLVHLLLDNNNLSGYLPPELSNLPKLLIIQLDGNNFSGSSIPPSYGNITTLLKLSLRNCSLEGPVPDVSGIPQLGYLDLSWNQLRGPITYNQFARNITTIDLSHNHLNGTIPGSFTGLPNLQRLSLDNNNLSGSVPSNIWQNIDSRGNRSLILDFQNNSLSNLSNLLSPPANVTIMLSGNPVCSIQNQQNISQYCLTAPVVVRGGSANNSSTLCEPCPTDLPFENIQMSPIPCLCAIPLFVDYRLKSPGFLDFVPYEVQFQQYLSSALSLSWYQLEISTFIWEEGPRLRMYLKLFPNNTAIFTASEVLRLEGLFTGWLIPDSDIFGPYELINFNTGWYNGNYGTMQPGPDCTTSCGNLSVPFPFGTKPGCFAKLALFLRCEPWLHPPSLIAPDGSVVTEISIDQGTLRVTKDEGSILLDGMDPTVYGFSGEWNGEVEWAIENMTCNDAMASKSTKSYRCVSDYSDCVDVTATMGYRCKCSAGFEGNPYIKDGCTDIDECQQQICHGVCHNTFGNYTCMSCPRGTDFSYSTGKCKPSNVMFGVTVGLCSGGGLLFLAVIFAVLIRRWRRNFERKLRKRYFRKNKGILLEQLISCDQDASDGGTKIFSLDELAKATNNFDQARVVGRGGFGTVYKGILTDQRVVAIKRSKLEGSAEIEQFINEVAILSRINHRNVVKLHGCCLEAEVPLLVYEFISNGTLYDLLHGGGGAGALLPLPWEERLRIAAEVAGALTYLHSAASTSILHRDVKCMNVLLNDSYTAKVSDFGASRSIPIDQTHLVTAVQGTFGYLDPEYYHTGQLNDKSDVYGFGVILLELLTRKKPVFENDKGEKQNLSNYFLGATGERPLEEVVDEQILGDASEEGMAGMARLAAECLSLTRGERPAMKDVEMRLQMLRARHAITTPLGGGGIPVPAGHRGSRQYSLELEFVSSSRVPR